MQVFFWVSERYRYQPQNHLIHMEIIGLLTIHNFPNNCNTHNNKKIKPVAFFETHNITPPKSCITDTYKTLPQEKYQK